MAYNVPTVFLLDINRLHQAGKLREGAQTAIGGYRPSTRPGQKEILVAGLGVLIWRGEAIEFEWQPIITRNPPPSWGTRRHARPKFRCPICAAGAYHLYLAGERFACRKCAQVEFPSREPENRDAAQFLRLDRLRAKVRALPVPHAPRSKWFFWRQVMKLRLAETAALSEFEAAAARASGKA
jgi:hypothetical protein